MGIFGDLFADAVGDQDMTDFTPEQNLAVLEALALAIYADGRVDDAERDKFDQALSELPWRWLTDEAEVARIVRETTARVRDLRSDEVSALVESIAERLPEQAIRHRVFRMMASIVVADRDLADGGAEASVLDRFVAAFAMDPQHARDILDVQKSSVDLS